MSFQKSPSDRKPPLAESMNQIRSRRRMLRSSIPSTPVSMMKPPTPKRLMTQELRHQYQSITTDLQSLMKMVKDEFGNQELGNSFSVTPFERGRFYDEYSARRNERLTRKGETVEKEKKKPTSVYNLGVVESSIIKKRGGGGGEQKKISLRKSLPANFSIPPTDTTSRYSLRSSSSTKDVTMSSGKLSFSGVNTRGGVGGVRKI